MRFTRSEIQGAVHRIAAEISRDHPDGVVVVGVLKGCLPLVADLVRALDVVSVVDFLSISSYRPGTGRVRLLMDLRTDIGGQDVVLVDDVVDTGLTLAFLIRELALRNPASLDVCALFDKAASRIAPVPIRYRGFLVGDEYLLGYGLDHEGRYRNTDEVVTLTRAALAADPDAALADLYPGTFRSA